jgi:hypothetical protein
MSDPSRTAAARPAFQGWLTILAAASTLVLLIGVVRALVTGASSPLLIAVAIILAASLTLLRSLRRTTSLERVAQAPRRGRV